MEENQVEVPARCSKDVSFSLSIPEASIEGVAVSQENLRNNVKFGLWNISPVIVQKFKAVITITKQGSKTPIIK